MGLKVGSRLRGQNSACEVIVVRGSDRPAGLMCAGLEMLPLTSDSDAPKAADGPAVELGKRYSDDESNIEVLCTKPGVGPLSFEGRDLIRAGARALPASD